MKRVVSTIVIIAFLSLQTGAYAQQLSYPAISNPNDVENVKLDRRAIEMIRTSEDAEYKKNKEKAMMEAVFEAEYKQSEADKEKARLQRLKRPIRGKREEAIIEGYKEERKRKMKEVLNGKERDLRAEELKSKEALRIIKREIPKGIDLGTGIARRINERIYPFKVSGDYQFAWGYDGGDENNEGQGGIWKDADFNKANMVYVLDNQYIFGQDRENTYDKRIFNRFRVKIESVREKGLNLLSEVVVDPWSFVGETDFFMLNSTNGQLPIQLRYWSNTQRTIDERIWLTNAADFVNIPEIQVHNGKTHATTVTSRWNEVSFDIPQLEINRDFRPLRKLEMNYKNDYADFKIFPLADHDHAYTSDDPLVLSNRHIYWEPSPWLNQWDPALYFPDTNDFRRGRWSNSIAFEARDSDFNFLTLLRGVSFEMDYEDTYIGGALAVPLNLWQDYDSVDSLPGAVRFKQTLFRNYYLGAVYTSNYGFDQQRIDAFNHVVGIDAGYEVPDFITLRTEYARSIDRVDWRGHDVRIARSKAEGDAFSIETKGEFLKDEISEPTLKVKTSFTHMGDNFRSRLSNYRNTRYDQFWGKHITFEPVSADFDAFRIGDGIDAGRNVYNFRLENRLFKDVFNSLFDMRFVKDLSGDKIENVYREEFTFKPMRNLATKFLFRYQDMPSTTLSRDSFIITDFISADNTDEFLTSDDIGEQKEASVWTWSLGLHYDPREWLGLEGIYEKTNDYDVFPQLTLNDASFRDLGNIRELDYFLYSQPLIAVPPYNPYSIYKARIFFTPFDYLRTKFEYVINTFKHATGRDDNISHYGIEVDLDMTDKLRGSFKFTRSQLIDLFMQQQRSADTPFHHHNNIFAKLEYDIDDNNMFIIQYGEFFVPAEFTPVSWLLNTVDTQRIVRFYIKGRF